MIQKDTLRVSLVIPAYNEELHLKACLDAIAAQTIQPFEVIVVDNGSADNTAAVACSYPFVRLLTEKRQGVIFARDQGFNAARGDIIGRIDADTLLSADWIETVQTLFTDSAVDAVSGQVHYYDVALRRVADGIDFFFRQRLARLLEQTDTVFLQGANMAMRRQAWSQISDRLCRQSGMHEDFDLAIHLQEYGYRVMFDTRLQAGISGRRADVGFISAAHYIAISPHTYALHHIRSRWHMYPVVAASLVLYVPAHIIYKGYDLETETFSWSRVFAPRQLPARIDPTSSLLNDF
jgi:glycosyltransferase involved in cell wall biosynthesis